MNGKMIKAVATAMVATSVYVSRRPGADTDEVIRETHSCHIRGIRDRNEVRRGEFLVLVGLA